MEVGVRPIVCDVYKVHDSFGYPPLSPASDSGVDCSGDRTAIPLDDGHVRIP